MFGLRSQGCCYYSNYSEDFSFKGIRACVQCISITTAEISNPAPAIPLSWKCTHKFHAVHHFGQNT